MTTPTQKELAERVARHMNSSVWKSANVKSYVVGSINKSDSSALPPRTMTCIASTPRVDYMGDTVDARSMTSRSGSVALLWQHDPAEPIGRAAWRYDSGSDCIRATITFAPQGVSSTADRVHDLCKSGVLTDVSVGFDPGSRTPRVGGGYDYKDARLMEISVVSIGANGDAVITSKSRVAYKSKSQRMAEARALARPEYKALLALEETKALAATASMTRAERVALAESMRHPPGAVVRELAPANTAQGYAERMNLHQLGVQGAASKTGRYTKEERLAIARQVIAESNRI